MIFDPEDAVLRHEVEINKLRKKVEDLQEQINSLRKMRTYDQGLL